ncbi:transcriptional regulator [Acetobacter nitrogenifigens DSM 23921 = NBRC 105050]|uniref:LysR family transcriptional regulator n=2 Tax=Acetobacter nitrogenifigens TaxID=285268 RepID=A0A511XBC6_9PROT|nr:LysR family transcriptional regulator [Acetobacter nitrogenifigens]GBQ90781.1 transcriptional regulator [Acetobacter nitrogenifigens DSM 23921 = NBRC 105050]GEN60254.1 LysR family transcriptional regulator [Acetobacter nitrogenifigens DSM 23921 = NBRC 105050]
MYTVITVALKATPEGRFVELDERWIFYLHESIVGGSVRAAADKLNVNPSAISRQIVHLEQAVGASLMERHSKGVRATEAGELVLDYYRRRRADHDDTLSRIEDIKGLRRGHISLALGEGFIDTIAAGPLARFWKRYPEISLNVEVTSTNDVARLLLEDAVHIGLIYNPPKEPRLRTHSVALQPVRVIARADHPFAALGRPLDITELLDQRIAQLQHSYGIRQIIDNATHISGLRIPAAVTTSSISMLKNFVEHGGGITLAPSFVAANEIQSGKFVAVPLRHNVLDASMHVMSRLGRQLPSAATMVLRQIGREFRRLEAADDSLRAANKPHGASYTND